MAPGVGGQNFIRTEAEKVRNRQQIYGVPILWTESFLGHSEMEAPRGAGRAWPRYRRRGFCGGWEMTPWLP